MYLYTYYSYVNISSVKCVHILCVVLNIWLSRYVHWQFPYAYYES